MKALRCFLYTTASSAALVGVATAADMPTKAPLLPASVPALAADCSDTIFSRDALYLESKVT